MTKIKKKKSGGKSKEVIHNQLYFLIPNVKMSRTNLEDLNAKEKDNRWLQLPICPRLIADPSSVCDSSAPDGGQENASSSSCEDYAHPSPKVLARNKLKNGFVVCCHDYVFRHSGKGGCFKKEDCIYYHPTNKRQEMMVRIAGKVNKDIKMLYSQRLAAEQQRLIHSASSLAPFSHHASVSNPYLTAPYHHPYFYTPDPSMYLAPGRSVCQNSGRDDSEEGNNRKRMRLDNNSEVCNSSTTNDNSSTNSNSSTSSSNLLQQASLASNPQGASPSLPPLSVLPLQGQHLGLLPLSPYFGLNYGMYPQYFPSNQ